MTQIIEKRTYDALLYDVVCTDILTTGETIASVASVTDDQNTLTYGIPQINSTAITYADGSVAAIGKVIQVEISAGTIPLGSDSRRLGEPNLLCTVRVRFTTNISPNQIEATVQILLKDTP